MGVGLGPDSYAIIEQGRIGQILNSKPMDRRAIIEEAAGITMYKTKRRLAEAKLEASKINLSRVNDILVEVEKQLASLKRQASKARRYAELREQMRGLLAHRAGEQGRASRYRSGAPRKSSPRYGRGRGARIEIRSRARRRAGTPERPHLRSRRRAAPDAESARADRARSRSRRKSHHVQSRAGRAARLARRAPRDGNRASRAPGRSTSPRAWTCRRNPSPRCAARPLRSKPACARRPKMFRRAPPSRAASKLAWKSCAASRAASSRNRRASRPNRCRRKKPPRATPPRKKLAPRRSLAIEQECLALEARLAGAENAFALASRQAQQSGAAVRESQAQSREPSPRAAGNEPAARANAPGVVGRARAPRVARTDSPRARLYGRRRAETFQCERP